jgi:ABC-2 type transport system permease protein
MKKFWLVAKYEYFRHVLRKRFIVSILSMPIFFAFIMGMGFLSAYMQYDRTPIGYVDHSGVLANAERDPSAKDVFEYAEITPFADEATADQALAAKDIRAYYVLNSDYLATGKVQVVANEVKGTEGQSQFRDFLLYNLLKDRPAEERERLLAGPVLEIRSLDGERSMGENNILGFLVPLIAAILLIISINTSGGYLLQALVEEKENRTMEIIVTSVSPMQLMAGKIVGNLSVGLTQIGAWLAVVIIALVIVVRFIPVGEGFQLDAGYLGLLILVMLPAFVMISALMALVGATATEAREAQQIAGLFTLPLAVPLWFISAIMANPNSALSIGLSLFRAGFTNIPLWQSILAVSLLILCAVGALWLAGRAFRLGMLRYGKRLTWHEIFGRSPRSPRTPRVAGRAS